MKTYTIHQGQSLIDIALELYGAAEMVVQLAVDNGLSLDADLAGTQILSYDDAITATVDTATYFRLNNLHVVTTGTGDESSLYEHNASEYGGAEHS